jgi:preprotein translocase subunit YajC
MSSDVIPNWDVIIHKNARTSDGGDAGNVIEVEEDTLTLERGPTAEYVISKSAVQGFDGSEVSLTISLKELNNQYRKK